MRSRALAALACAAALLAAASAEAAQRQPDVPVVYDKLANGLKVVLSEDHVAPVVTVAVYYGVGFRIEPRGQTGFAHLFEHMMFQGSSHVKKFEHARLVEANGGSYNGSTRLDFTNYYETLPNDRLSLALWLEADRMRSLDVTRENLENQQNVVSEEVRENVLNQPYASFEWLDLWMNANQNWYNAHNFYGDLAEIQAAKIDDVQKFFKTYYAPNNAVLTVVGDFDPRAVRSSIEKYFAGIPAQPTPPRPDLAEPPQTAEKHLRETDKLAKLPALAFGYHIPLRTAPDYPAVVLLDLILQGDDSSRLYQRLVKQKQISVDWEGGINLGLGNEFDYDGPMLLSARTVYKAEHDGSEIVAEIDSVVADIQKNGATSRELHDAKVRFRSNFYDQLESGVGKANLLASFALFDDDPSRINTIVPAYEAVTIDQIRETARKYLVPSNRTVIDRIPAKGGQQK
jgi:zinc protease